jgi:hypothetical protein
MRRVIATLMVFLIVVSSLAVYGSTEVVRDRLFAQTKDPLMFPKDNFTVETKMVKTTTGEKKVTYHSYMHIPYVVNTSLYWDAGHGADQDPEEFIVWIGNITGYRKNNSQ